MRGISNTEYTSPLKRTVIISVVISIFIPVVIPVVIPFFNSMS